MPPPCPSPLRSYSLGISILLRLGGFGLQFGRGSPYYGLLESSQYRRSAGSGGIACLGVITRKQPRPMTVLFESCLVYTCGLLTPQELSNFVVLEMTQCVAPWRGMLGVLSWGEARMLGASSIFQGFL